MYLIHSILQFVTLALWTAFILVQVIIFLKAALVDGIRAGFIAMLSIKRIFLWLLALLSVTILNMALIFVKPDQMAVVISIFSDQGIHEEPITAGVDWIIPFAERAIFYPRSIQSYTMASRPNEGEEPGDDSITARTSDGQEVKIDCSLQFRLIPEKVVQLHIDWQDRYTKELLRQRLRGMVRSAVSQYKVDDVNSNKRDIMESNLEDNLKKNLSNEGIELEDFILRNIGFSDAYGNSVEQKQVAEQGVTQKEYEATQLRNLADGQADKIRKIAQAEADAIIIIAKAEAEAKEINAKSEAEALRLISPVIAQNPALIKLKYLQKLNPNVKVMLLPEDASTILSMPRLGDDLNEAISNLDLNNLENLDLKNPLIPEKKSAKSILTGN
jgi:regulator of protease activity HflC (stomatin/prohibitin superfamily)|tara:strand:+ start:2096 stop:3253 length:1158 start_codon:yes stop_codon:yes gene_type:complete